MQYVHAYFYYSLFLRTKKIVNVMTPEAEVLVLERGRISHIVNMHYSFKNLLLYSQA